MGPELKAILNELAQPCDNIEQYTPTQYENTVAFKLIDTNEKSKQIMTEYISWGL